MCAVWPYSFEMVEDGPHIIKALVRWVYRKTLGNVKLMFRRIFINEITNGNLQSDVAFWLPPPTVKLLEYTRI